MAAKEGLNPGQHLVGYKIAHSHDDGIVGRVMALVMAIEVVARHLLQVDLVTNHLVVVGMHAEGGRLQLFLQIEERLVFVHVPFGDDDGAL